MYECTSVWLSVGERVTCSYKLHHSAFVVSYLLFCCCYFFLSLSLSHMHCTYAELPHTRYHTYISISLLLYIYFMWSAILCRTKEKYVDARVRNGGYVCAETRNQRPHRKWMALEDSFGSIDTTHILISHFNGWLNGRQPTQSAYIYVERMHTAHGTECRISRNDSTPLCVW